MQCVNSKLKGVIALPNGAANHHFIIAHWKEKHCLCQCTKMYLGLVQMNCAVYTPFYFFQIPDLLYIVRTIISHDYTHFTPSLWYIERNGDLSEASCPADIRLHSWPPPPPPPPPMLFTETRFNRRDQRDPIMDEGTIKTPNPKCRLYWCFIELIDWRYSQSC